MDYLKKLLKHIAFPLAALIFIPVYTAFGDVDNEINTLVRSMETALNQRKANEVIALCHPDSDLIPAIQNNLQNTMDQGNMPTIQMKVLEITQYDAGVLAKIETITTPPGEAPPEKKIVVLALRPFEGQLKITGIYDAPDTKSFDDQSRVFSSQKGKFAITIPEGWLPLKGSSILRALTPDPLIALAPDFQSQVAILFVQMPLKLGDDNAEAAQKIALADRDVEKRLSLGHQVIDQRETRIAGLDGYRTVTRVDSTIDGGVPRKILRVYLVDHPMLYFFACVAIGPEQYDNLRPQFDALVSSFHLLPMDAGQSLREAVVEEQGHGAVTGQVYTSEEFNCFIAAPGGWEIRTSPNPGNLAEMQYAGGQSIVRLDAARGLPESAKINEVALVRIQQVKAIVQDFNEISRRNITVRGTPGIESIQTYQMEALGKVYVKEWTLIHNNTCYRILCQCIEPDDYTVLEKDFDQILESFGFIRD